MRLSILSGALLAVLVAGALPVASATTTQARTGIQPMLLPVCGGDDGGPDPDPDLKRRTLTATAAVVGRTLAPGAALALGTDRAAVEAKFAANIEANFQRAPETLLGRLSDKELAAIFRHYGEKKALEGSPLLKTLASRASAQSLTRLRTVTDAAAVDRSVAAFADSKVQASYATESTAHPYVSAIQPMQGPAPTIDMTLDEIYLEFRTAPVGSVGPAAAVAETGMYASVYVGAAWVTGTAVGTQINNIITTYDPSLSDTIGGTIAGMVDASRAAADDVTQGHYQSAIDELFGYPVTDANEGAADYDVAAPMVEYYGDGGSCGM